MSRHIAYEDYEQDLSPHIRAQLARWSDEEEDLLERRQLRRARQVTAPVRRRMEPWRDLRARLPGDAADS